MTGKSTKGGRYLRPAIFFVAIPVLIFVAFYDSNIHGAIDVFHEGESLAPAFESLQGKLPFRDIYLQHGWGVNLLRTRLAFSLFGVSVAANRKLGHGDVSGYFIAASWTVVYLLLYSLYRRKMWIVPAFALLAFGDVLINDRHLMPFLSIALLAAGRKGGRLQLFFAGLFAATGVFHSFDTGIYAVAIGMAFILFSSVGNKSSTLQSFCKMTVSYAGGLVLGMLPFFAYLLWRGILDDFLVNCYFQMRYQAETWGIVPPSIASLFGPFENATARNRTFYLFIKWYYPLFVYVCVSLVLAPALALRKLEENDTAILLTTIAGIIFFRSAMGRADEGHLMYSIAPFWVLNICFIERAFLHHGSNCMRHPAPVSSRLEWFHRWCFSYFAVGVISLGLALYFLATCRNGGIVARRARLEAWKEKGLPRCAVLDIPRAGGVRVPPEQAEELKRTISAVQSLSDMDEPIFDFSNQGAYYFLAGRANSTSFCQSAYAIPLRMQERMIEQLGNSPPVLVLSSEAEYSRHIAARQPLVCQWIRERYPIHMGVNSNDIFLRENPPEGCVPAELELSERSISCPPKP